jgi:hypothetical protein
MAAFYFGRGTNPHLQPCRLAKRKEPGSGRAQVQNSTQVVLYLLLLQMLYWSLLKAWWSQGSEACGFHSRAPG